MYVRGVNRIDLFCTDLCSSQVFALWWSCRPVSEVCCLFASTWTITSHCGGVKPLPQLDGEGHTCCFALWQSQHLIVFFCMTGPVISVTNDLCPLCLPLNPLFLFVSASSLQFPPSTAAACFLRRYVLKECLKAICHLFCSSSGYFWTNSPLGFELWSLTVLFWIYLFIFRRKSENLETSMVHSHRQLPLLLWIHNSKYVMYETVLRIPNKYFVL